MSVASNQRHTRANGRCPICGGADGDPRGRDVRCNGYTSPDERWAFCSRVELDSHHAVTVDSGVLYAHLLRDEPRVGRTEVKAYPYRDERGELLYENVRFEPKDFRLRKAGAQNGEWKINGTRRVLYRLPELLEDDGDRPVFFTDGEKDADALVSRGFTATCCTSMGAWSSVEAHARSTLRGRDVVLVADRDVDGKGEKNAKTIAASLAGHARSVRIILPREPHKDVSNVLDAGGSLEDLVELGASSSVFDQRRHLVTSRWFENAPPPREYLLHDMRTGVGALTSRGTTLLVAAGGVGKGFAALWLALAVSTGATRWLGELEAGRGRVLFVSVEDDKTEVEGRLYYVARSLDVTKPGETFEVLDLRGVEIALLTPELIRTERAAELLAFIAKNGPFALVIFDSIGRIAGCNIDGDNAAAAALVSYFDAVGEASRGAVIAMHHTDKVARRLRIVDATASRGATGLGDYSRAVIVAHVDEIDHGDDAVNERLGEIVTVAMRKSNYTRKWKPIELRRGSHGELIPLDAADRKLLEDARRQSSNDQAERTAKKAAREADVRKRDEEDDAAARKALEEKPDAKVREIVAIVKAVRACGTERAHAAVLRSRRSVPGGVPPVPPSAGNEERSVPVAVPGSRRNARNAEAEVGT